MNINYDRLTGMETNEDKFDFICPYSGRNGIKEPDVFKIDIVGVPFKPDIVDNSDLPEQMRRYYNSLPTKRQAILNHIKDTEKEYLLITSKYGGYVNTHGKVIDKAKLRKWCNMNLPEVLDLRRK